MVFFFITMMTFCLKIAVHVIVVEIVWEIVLPVIQSFTNLTIHQNKTKNLSLILKKNQSQKKREKMKIDIMPKLMLFTLH